MSRPKTESPGTRVRKESARTVALKVLWKVEHDHLFADDAFDRIMNKIALQTRDRALAFDLVYGVLRYRETLDWRLNRVADRGIHRLPLAIALALRLGAYQLLYLDRIPVSAAVKESVDLVKPMKGRDWTGFVNGVLRGLSRQSSSSWPDPDQDPVQALSIRYSCPRWLAERWLAQFGMEGATSACRQTLEIPPLTLRTNLLRCSRRHLEARLSDLGYHAEPTLVSPVGLVLSKCGPLTTFEPLQEGWCYIEDEAAQLVPLLLDVQPGHRVLDVCAAPGGKTSHLAALMNNQGEIIATDLNPQRVTILEANCRRLGVTIVKAYSLDMLGVSSQSPNSGRSPQPRLSDLLETGFDRILVDAPCSGLGVLRRHPEAKWQKGPEQLPHHHTVQSQLLDQVSRLLRPDGVLVYSACSVEPEESTQIISRFCREHPEFHHEAATPWLPPLGHSLVNQAGDLMTLGTPHGMDGFFASRLRKVTDS